VGGWQQLATKGLYISGAEGIQACTTLVPEELNLCAQAQGGVWQEGGVYCAIKRGGGGVLGQPELAQALHSGGGGIPDHQALTKLPLQAPPPPS
jgi:hypothetical protein